MARVALTASIRNRGAFAGFKTRNMETLLTSVVLGLLCGCATDPSWSWRKSPDSTGEKIPAAGAVVVAHAEDPQHVKPMRALPSGAPTYKYGAKFEPPDGRILHGMGQWPEGNKNYLAVLNDPALEPGVRLFFIDIGDWPRSWESRSHAVDSLVAEEVALGRILHISLALRTIDDVSGGEAERPIDTEIATSTRYDDHIRDVARSIKHIGVPAFIRIGFEFSGSWNGYHPYVFPKAYRHIVDLFREEHVDNAAFVWCWEGSCPGDFDQRDKEGWRWYPGDDVVDWFGADLFIQGDFSGTAGRSGRSSRYGNTLKFLDMAEEHHRPVMIAESSAITVGITPDEMDGRRDWEAWFDPFFQLLADHPGIKAFFYCNTDWKHNHDAQAQGWLDADISHNDYIGKRYAQQMHDPVFLHKRELPLLKGWTPPPPQPEGPAAPKPPPPRRGPAGASGN